MTPAPETDYTEFITCPHCGYVETETADYPTCLRYDGDRASQTCMGCEEDYNIECHVEWTYSTTKWVQP